MRTGIANRLFPYCFREPLLIPFAALACGICIAHWFPEPPARDFYCLDACAALLAVAASIRSRLPAALAAAAALVLAGITLVETRPPRPAPRLSVPDNAAAIFDGCVVEPAIMAADHERFTVEFTPGARAEVSLYARPGEKFPVLPYGTLVEFAGKVRTPHNYNDPGAFDEVRFLARQRIYWTASTNASDVRILPGRCGNGFARAIFRARSAAIERLDRLYAEDAYADGMMQAVLVGATAKLDHMWTEDYRSTGTYHALIISGTHVAVVSMVLLFLLRLCAVPESIAMAIAVAVTWFYAGVTGWQTPVIRSAAGMTLFGIARCFFWRKGRLLNLVALVAIVFVAIDPEELFDAGFQLSFLAVGAIGAFVLPLLEATSTPLVRALPRLGEPSRDLRLAPRAAQFLVEMRLLARTLTSLLRVPQRAALFIVGACVRLSLFAFDMAVASFFIQIGVALPMIVYFHRTSFSGASANIFIVPLLSAIVPLGFLAIATNSPALAHLCAKLLDISRLTAAFHARVEPAWRIPPPPVWLGAVFCAALIVAAWRGRHSIVVRIAAWMAAAGALALIVIHPFRPVVSHGQFELAAIDVGQGDALFAAFPDGRLMMIDAGGIPSFGRIRKPGIDIGEEVVSPYLWSRSIRRLDVVVMTHAHEDHMGGMSAVLRNFRPHELWTGATQNSPEWRSVESTAHSLGIVIRHRQRGEAFAFGGTNIRVLAPAADYEPAAEPKNDDSLVMRIQFGRTSFLLTGDMEKKTEEDLFVNGLLEHADVLKVGHHGSRTSSTPDLLDSVHPAFGIVSAGFENSYGHPHPATIAALGERHVAIYRTDRQGLIQVLSDGRRIAVAKATD